MKKYNLGISNLLAVLLIILVAALVGGGVWWWMNSKQTTTTTTTSTTAITQGTTTTTASGQDETAGWKTYTNNEIGFSFKYPATYTITKNQPAGGPTGGLILQDTTNTLEPELSLWVDPAGWGPFFPQIVYTLAQDGNGIKIVKREENESEYSPKDKIEIMTKGGEGGQIGVHYYWFFFRFNKGGADLEPVFQKILSTFQIIK